MTEYRFTNDTTPYSSDLMNTPVFQEIARRLYAYDDILAALKSAKIQLRALGGDDRGNEWNDSVQSAVLNKIDDAIAKAEGKS